MIEFIPVIKRGDTERNVIIHRVKRILERKGKKENQGLKTVREKRSGSRRLVT